MKLIQISMHIKIIITITNILFEKAFKDSQGHCT